MAGTFNQSLQCTQDVFVGFQAPLPPVCAVPQKAVVRQARTTASLGLLALSFWHILVKCSTVQGSFSFLLASLGDSLLLALKRVLISLLSIFYLAPWMMCHALMRQNEAGEDHHIDGGTMFFFDAFVVTEDVEHQEACSICALCVRCIGFLEYFLDPD